MRPSYSFPRHSRGFSLLEVFLALGLMLAVMGLSVGQLKRDTDAAQANAVGDQLNAVGNAMNSYIAMRFPQLVTLTDIDGTGYADDPGPRDCTPIGAGGVVGWCTITSDTLRRNGLLPLSFSGRNAYGASYLYYIRVQGTAPSFSVDGLVTTHIPYTMGGATPRYDLLGQAMLAAGADAGITRDNAQLFEGLNGGWNEAGFADYLNARTSEAPIAQTVASGLLGFRAGYGSSGYASYVRTDGGSVMTGNLNLGTNDITNVGDMRAIGNVNAGQLIGRGNDPDAMGTALLLGDPLDQTNATVFQTGPGIMTVRNTGGVSFLNASDVGIPLTAGTLTSMNGLVNLGSGGLQASGSNLTLLGNGNLTTTTSGAGTGDITAGGQLRSVGNTQVGGSVLFNGSVTEGADCSLIGSGALNRTATKVVQCTGGVWTSLAATMQTITSSASCSASTLLTATCPLNHKVTGGGYLPAGAATLSYPPDRNGPLGTNGWQIRTAPSSNGCYQAVAMCVFSRD